MGINIRHTLTISAGSIIYILLNFTIGISLLCSKWAEGHKYTMSLMVLPLVLCYIALPIGTNIRVLSFYFRRVRMKKFSFHLRILKVSLGIIKAFVHVAIWGIIYLYYLVISIKDWATNKNPIYRGMLKKPGEDVLGKALLLTIIFMTINILNTYSIEQTLKMPNIIYKRLSYYINRDANHLSIVIILVVALLIGRGGFVYSAYHINQMISLIIYPCIICVYMFVQEKLIRICVWNYDWEQRYGIKLKAGKVAPNIESVPFPKG